MFGSRFSIGLPTVTDAKKKKERKKAKAGDFLSELNMSVCVFFSFTELLKRAALRYLTQFPPNTMERKKDLYTINQRADESCFFNSRVVSNKKGEGERSADCCFHAITLHLFLFFVCVCLFAYTLFGSTLT